MKKVFAFMVLFSIILCVNAQEPGNNLGKSLASIQQSFPNLSFLRTENGYQIYKSNGEGNDFTSFYFSNGRLVGEYTYIFDYSRSGYITDAYRSLINILTIWWKAQKEYRIRLRCDFLLFLKFHS